jgi:hypothetical protein
MIANRIFNGKMSLDVQPYRVGQGDYPYALNITRDAQGGGQDKVVSNIVGNRLVNYALPSGTNKTIGSREDAIRNRIYFFVWNNEGNHSILYYDRGLGTVNKLLVSKTDSNGIDILGFSPSYRINHVDIIYKDDGDLIFWTDGLNRPFFLNETDAINNLYGTNWLVEYITVNRMMPLIAPICSYANDTTVNLNNQRKKLYQFRYRWTYTNLTKSTWSPISKLFAPQNPDDISTDINPQKNNRIDVTVHTGGLDVLKIEIAARQSFEATYSDFFLVTVLNKSELSILSNSLTTYKFYNDASYPIIDSNESLLLYSYVPQKAFTQGLPNGSVLTYGAITEGYDFDETLDVVSTISTVDNTPNTGLTIQITQGVYRDGVTPDITRTGGLIFTFSGGLTNVSKVTLRFTTNRPIQHGGMISSSAIYTVLPGNTIQDVINGLFAVFPIFVVPYANPIFDASKTDTFETQIPPFSLMVFDWTRGTLGNFAIDGSVTIDYSGQVPVNDVNISAYKHKARYGFGLVYFDEYGETDGVHYQPETMGLAMPELITTGGTPPPIPQIVFSIRHQPPVWATNYSWVRTTNLTYLSSVTTVSLSTILDLANKYGYIGISNLQSNQNNYSAYEFLEGDRVRVIGKYIIGNQGTPLSPIPDFPIIELVVNPTINTATVQGTFIKIPYSADISGFGNAANQNYLVEIYTPAPNIDVDGTDVKQQVYYEFGETYPVLNAGTSLRAHGGQQQDQIYANTVPTLPPPVATQVVGGTISSGSYRYRITFILSGGGQVGISEPSNQITISVITPNKTVDLSGIPISPNPDVVARNIYRDKNGGIPVLVGTINDNITTTFTDSSDTTLGLVLYQPALFSFVRGDYYQRTRLYTISPQQVNYVLVWVMSQSVSDLYPSRVQSIGRAFIVDDDAANTYFPTTVRFGGEYQQNTNINKTNIYFPENLDDYDRSNGDIRKLFIEGRYMYVFQKFDVGVVPILTQIVRDVSGNPLEANSDNLLNKITYPYKGKYGIGDVPESFAYHQYAKYFVDDYKGVVLRLSQDGITELSVLYQCNSFFVDKLKRYRKSLNTGVPSIGTIYTGDPTVYGVFDYYTNRYIVALEEINRYNYIILPPLSPPTATLASGGTLSVGTYSYRVTYVNAGGDESPVSKISQYVLTTVGNATVELTDIPISPDPLVTKRNIYRDKNGSGIYLLLTTINNNTTTVFTNNSDTALGGQPPTPPTKPISHQDPYTLPFAETRDTTEGFECFTSYFPEGMSSLGTLLVAFKGGEIWTHDNPVYCNFFGQQFDAEIDGVFNDSMLEKKTWTSVAQQSNTVWSCPEIETQTKSYGSVPQQSELIASDFEEREGTFHAAFLNDSNSIGGLIEGDSLKGNWLRVKFRKQNASEFVFLNMISTRFIDSPLTVKT